MDPSDTPERGDDLTAAPVTVGGWLAQNALTLVIVAAAAVLVCLYLDVLRVALMLVGLGLVIFIHELGHFLAAKWCDVHVETFSIGFGPPLPGCRFQYGETVYQVAVVPLGGYVKMVGEGAEEEGEDDPRSFKNKTVGQRMLIISAGVIMNILMAAICYIGVYMTTGVERPAGVIGTVDSGSPAWTKGLRPGAEIVRIGNAVRPYFDDVMPEVVHWSAGEPIPMEYEVFNGGRPQTNTVEITPRQNRTVGRPMIGIGPARTARLRPPTRAKVPPCYPGSAASKADPPFQDGDRIVGATDPDNPDRTTPLPPDPRDPAGGRRDFFDLSRRFHRLAGRPMTLLVERANGAEEAVRVPPAFHTTYGIRLGMGQIVAVRDDSPAATAGVQARTGDKVGDILTGVEVTRADGATIRYVTSPDPQTPPNVTERTLDPVRLPDELRRWAAERGPGRKAVKVTLARKRGHNENGEVVQREVAWDDRWSDEPSVPSGQGSPQAIDELGLAYTVTTHVDDVAPDSPATRAVVAKAATIKAPAGDVSLAKGDPFTLQKGDVITKVQFYTAVSGTTKPLSWIDLKDEDGKLGEHGAFLAYTAQELTDVRKIGLTVIRSNAEVQVELDGVEDMSWPQADRGLVFDGDLRLEKASTLGQALSMGVGHTWRTITRIYQSLAAMAGGRISF
ncbi:MAG TPA: site-2 protease family protein, partial [Gemmataceae bacterium]